MDSLQDMLDLVKGLCHEEVSEVAYNLWIKDIAFDRFDGSVVCLKVDSEFRRQIAAEKYLPLLKEKFEQVLGFEVQVQLGCDSAAKAPAAAEPAAAAAQPARSDDTLPHGEYEYTFSTFICGPSNKFAHAAAMAVAANPANAYNPLFIYGDSGLGKTHLLYAIRKEIQQNMPEKKIIYSRGEEFTNELISAIANDSTASFHEKYRQADVLLVDDIHFIGGRVQTQEEFFNTFNELHQAGKQIVLTSDRPPKEIKTLEDRLRTRFEWGLLADIQPPEFETRIAIIRRKAELLELEIPDDVAEYIANKLKSNIRQLEGTVKKLKAYQMFSDAPPSLLFAQNAIRDILSDNQPTPVTVERIISEVARTYGVSSQDIRSTKRAAPISAARQTSMYIVRNITQMSMSDIGKEFGGKDHATVVYALQQVEKKMAKDMRYKETVEDIIKNIRDN